MSPVFCEPNANVHGWYSTTNIDTPDRHPRRILWVWFRDTANIALSLYMWIIEKEVLNAVDKRSGYPCWSKLSLAKSCEKTRNVRTRVYFSFCKESFFVFVPTGQESFLVCWKISGYMHRFPMFLFFFGKCRWIRRFFWPVRESRWAPLHRHPACLNIPILMYDCPLQCYQGRRQPIYGQKDAF